MEHTPQSGRDEGNWAKPVDRLEVTSVPEGVANINVEGRRIAGFSGFGKMWQKTYSCEIAVPGLTPAGVVSTWRQSFGELWPKGNRFYAPLTGISPGDVALINVAMPGRIRLSTGVVVVYADDESFSFMSPEGHMFAGMITFSAAPGEHGPLAQVQVLIRANDPLYEIGMPILGHRMEDRFWSQTLRNLAARHGLEAQISVQKVCVDRRRNWSKAGNIRYNAAIRTLAHTITRPLRRRAV